MHHENVGLVRGDRPVGPRYDTHECRMVSLALRPGFRLKARSPSIAPPGAGDDTSLGKQSSGCRASCPVREPTVSPVFARSLPLSLRICCEQSLPMPRVRRALTPADQRHVAKREAGRFLQPAERDPLDQREDVALEGGEVDELAVLSPPPVVAGRRTGANTGARGGSRRPFWLEEANSAGGRISLENR